MCGPAALIPLTIASTALAAGGQIYAGNAAKNQGRYEQKIAEGNAARDRNAATDASNRGQVAQLQRYRALAQSLGAQRAGYAANGLDANFGSALETQLGTTQIGYEDSATLAENTRREMMGFDVSAANQVMQGRAARARGDAAKTASLFQAGSTILSGSQQVAKLKAGG